MGLRRLPQPAGPLKQRVLDPVDRLKVLEPAGVVERVRLFVVVIVVCSSIIIIVSLVVVMSVVVVVRSMLSILSMLLLLLPWIDLASCLACCLLSPNVPPVYLAAGECAAGHPSDVIVIVPRESTPSLFPTISFQHRHEHKNSSTKSALSVWPDADADAADTGSLIVFIIECSIDEQARISVEAHTGQGTASSSHDAATASQDGAATAGGGARQGRREHLQAGFYCRTGWDSRDSRARGREEGVEGGGPSLLFS